MLVIEKLGHGAVGSNAQNLEDNGRILRINPSGESKQFASDDKLELYHYADSSYTFQRKTTQVFRDTAWYHIVIAFDTTQSTSTDRVKFYVNGTQVTSFSTSSYPSQNFQSYFNLESEHAIFGSDLFPSGYVSQVNWIDGQALTADSFGFTDVQTNTWKPKKYIGSFTSTTSDISTLNTSFATSPPTDSTGNYYINYSKYLHSNCIYKQLWCNYLHCF